MRFPGGVQIKARGQKGPPEALSGPPKGPRDIGKMGPGSRQPQNVCFYTGNTTFFKKRQSAPGGGPGCVFRVNLEPREGPGPPRVIFDVFRGGPRPPSGLRSEIPGGARGAKGAPFLLSGPRFGSSGVLLAAENGECFLRGSGGPSGGLLGPFGRSRETLRSGLRSPKQ